MSVNVATVPRLTQKQEQFAQNIAAGMTQAEAYKHAYDISDTTAHSTVTSSACRLAKKPHISKRIQQIMVKLADDMHLTTREQQLERLVHTQTTALRYLEQVKKSVDADGNIKQDAHFNRSAADTIVKCADAINKMCGYNEPDKVDSTLKIEFAQPQHPALESGKEGDMIDVVDYKELSE